jgi:hypothetical protein
MEAAQKISTKRMRSKRRGKAQPPKLPGLTVKQVDALKTRLRGVDKQGRRAAPYLWPTTEDGRPAAGPPRARTFAASPFWIDAQIVTRTMEIGGEEVSYQEHDPRAVPAGLCRCRGCGRQTPPQMVTSSGHCWECRWEQIVEIAKEIGLSGFGGEQEELQEKQTSSLVVMVGGVPSRYVG